MMGHRIELEVFLLQKEYKSPAKHGSGPKLSQTVMSETTTKQHNLVALRVSLVPVGLVSGPLYLRVIA